MISIFSTTASDAAGPKQPQPKKHHASDCTQARKGLSYYRQRYLDWRFQMGAGQQAGKGGNATPTRGRDRVPCPRVRYLAKQARLKTLQAAREWHIWFQRIYAKWRCIHEHEGAWNANTGNGYWGGLQMTMAFQWAHGPEFARRWGTADRWPPWAQLIAAERAWKADGESFREWGTAGMCGLR